MAAFNFPNSPSTNDLHTENNVTWKWNGTVWKRQHNSYLTASTLNITGIGTFGGVLKIPTVAGTNTNSNLNVLFQTATGVIDGGSGLQYNPAQDVLKVNGNFINANTFRGDGDLGTLTCDNHSATTFVSVSSKVDIGIKDNTAGAFNIKEGSNEYITVDTTNSSEVIKFGTAGSERLRITSDGRLWLGINSWSGHASCDDLIIGDGSGHRGLTVYSGSSNDGGIYFADGTSSNASYRGIIGYEHANDAMAFRTAALERLRIDSNGRLLLGTTTVGQSGEADALTVYQSGHTGITIRTGGTSNNTAIYFADGTSGDQNYRGSVTYTHADDNLVFKTAATENLRLNAGVVQVKDSTNTTQGNARILISKGTGSDGAARIINRVNSYLHLGGTEWGANGTGVYTLSFGYTNGTTGVHVPAYVGFKETSVASYTSGDLVFGLKSSNGDVAPVERLRITSTGMVGIGVSQPAVAGGYHGMEIGGTTNTGIRLSGTAAGSWAFTDYEINGSQKFIAGCRGGDSSWRIATGASLDANVKFYLDSNGNFGFGDIGPANFTGYTNLSIHGSTGGAITFGDDGTDEWEIYAGNDMIKVYDRANTAEILRIETGGVVSIGGLASDIAGNKGIEISNAATTEIRLKNSSGGSGANDGLAIQKWSNGNSYIWEYDANNILFGTSNTQRLQITSDGKILHNNANSYHADADDLVLKERSGGNVGMTFQNTGTGYGVIYFADSGSQHSGRIQYDHSNDSLDLFTGGSERLAIRSSGQVEFKNGSFSDNVDCVMANGGTMEIGAQSTMKFRTATNHRANLDSNGYFSVYNQPSFSAYQAQSSWSVSANAVMAFNATRHNIGGHYNTSNGKFTAPIAGRYLFTFYTIMTGNYNSGYVRYYKNGARLIGGDTHFTTNSWLGSQWHNVSFSNIIDLNANDYIEVRNGYVAVTYHGNNWQLFCGCLLG